MLAAFLPPCCLFALVAGAAAQSAPAVSRRDADRLSQKIDAIVLRGQIPRRTPVRTTVTESGSNYADVGFEYDPETGRVVAIAAIDNLMKGAAGTAVQCMNIMHGWEETAGS